MESLLTYDRLHSDTAGESHFARLEISLSTRHFAPPAPPFGVSELTPVSRCGFLRVLAGFVGDLHPSPLHMWIFFLNGEMEFEASDGERRRDVPGNALLLEDTTGKGHRSRVPGAGCRVPGAGCRAPPTRFSRLSSCALSFFNEEDSMGNRFLRLAVIYLLVGVTLGIGMAASHNYTMRPVHAHLNLLGWASMGLFGLWYRSAPAAADTRLAKVHFWLHNLALPVQMVTLAMFMGGNQAVEPVLALASVVIGVGLVCFAINLWKHTGS